MTNRAKMGRDPAPRKTTPWPLYLAGGALVVLIIGLIVLWQAPRETVVSPAQDAGGPRLAIDQEKIDFGKVGYSKPVKATFVLSNTGDQPLQILEEPAVRVVEGC